MKEQVIDRWHLQSIKLATDQVQDRTLVGGHRTNARSSSVMRCWKLIISGQLVARQQFMGHARFETTKAYIYEYDAADELIGKIDR